MARRPTPAPAPAQPWAAATGGNTATTQNPDPGATPSPDGAGAQSTQSAGVNADSTADTSQNPQGEASGNGGGVNADASAESAADAPTVVTSTEDIPSSDAGEMPGMDSDDVDIYDTHGQAERLAENDVAQTAELSTLPSFVRDQISPSGIDIALEADRSAKPTLERSAYPSLGEKLHQMTGRMTDDQMQRFEDRMVELAEDVLSELQKADRSAEITDNLIDGTAHYGPRVRSPAAQADADGSVGMSNAERNRRARRAAERVSLAAQARFTGKQ